ncbi:hypothetical protein N2152v2_004493 [Parachlorella kessleri]
MGKQKKRQAEKQSFTVSQNEEELNKKYNLYQDAVQSPKGDISWFLKFFRQYVGGRPPRHLREDFCGTALVCVTWCKGDVFRSAVGLDLDPEPLQWGMRNNAAQLGGSAPRQLCLLQCNVLDDPAAASEIPHPAEPSSSPCSEPDSNPKPALEAEDSSEGLDVRSRPADIVCALNFGVCLLHQRSELLRYFQRVRAALSPEGGIFVADLLGGHAAEAPVKLPRQNAVTGLHYVWEQGTFNPVTRHVNGYISLKCPQTKQVLKHAFSYHWKLWTILDVVELLLQAAFASTHVWEADEEAEGSEADEADFVPYTAALAADAGMLQLLSRGWTAYIVAVT